MKMPNRFLENVPEQDTHVWSDRDHALGSLGRRHSDPQYEEYVFNRGINFPRSLADDGAKLLNKKERAAFEYALAIAQSDPSGHCILFEEHLPDRIRRMPGGTPRQVGINTGKDGIVFEPRWTMYDADGHSLGGRLYADDAPTTVVRQRVITTRHLPDVHIPADAPNSQVYAEPSRVRTQSYPEIPTHLRPLTLFGRRIRG